MTDTATELVSTLPTRLPEVASFNLIRYTPRPGVEERIPDAFRSNEAFASAPDLPNRETTFIAELVKHDDRGEIAGEQEVQASRLTLELLLKVSKDLKPSEALGISSRCLLRTGDLAHLPLLDFRPAPSVANEDLVSEACRALGIRHGAILHSGRSYHAYGFAVLSEKVWFRLMLKSLLLTSLVDVRYVAHRLLEERAVLRITPSHRKPMEPVVVRMF